MKTKKQVLPLQGSRSIFNISIPLLSPVETTVPCKENRESNIQEDYETLLLTLLTCNLFTFICIVENTDAPYFAQSKTQRSWEVTAVFQIQYIKKKNDNSGIFVFLGCILRQLWKNLTCSPGQNISETFSISACEVLTLTCGPVLKSSSTCLNKQCTLTRGLVQTNYKYYSSVTDFTFVHPLKHA